MRIINGFQLKTWGEVLSWHIRIIGINKHLWEEMVKKQKTRYE